LDTARCWGSGAKSRMYRAARESLGVSHGARVMAIGADPASLTKPPEAAPPVVACWWRFKSSSSPMHSSQYGAGFINRTKAATYSGTVEPKTPSFLKSLMDSSVFKKANR
jgi:hypothetical protein